MAIKGLSIPAFADYHYDGNTVKYTNGFICGSAIEYGAEIETSEDNPLYGDDKIIEHDDTEHQRSDPERFQKAFELERNTENDRRYVCDGIGL